MSDNEAEDNVNVGSEDSAAKFTTNPNAAYVKKSVIKNAKSFKELVEQTETETEPEEEEPESEEPMENIAPMAPITDADIEDAKAKSDLLPVADIKEKKVRVKKELTADAKALISEMDNLTVAFKADLYPIKFSSKKKEYFEEILAKVEAYKVSIKGKNFPFVKSYQTINNNKKPTASITITKINEQLFKLSNKLNEKIVKLTPSK